ncbi:MAG: M23 family metallopeptidase, partial [Anaerolineales bacterium]|nr:M23 family metallopeptidase [Anaerolineales bacterium]
MKIYITATPDISKKVISSVTPRQTATISPSPTPTAPGFREIDEITEHFAVSPISQPGAPCGFGDYFDFPLDAPDGAAAQGGADYNIYRSRYGKFHTGEDWRYSRIPNFRAPVYSVGHGVVTYAEPLGWGADQGVIIIQHTFRDGLQVLSFYGHLDPPSVNLNPGDCVQRGDWIGSIGNPRSSPHLHFEIRSHMPFGPGPG